MTEEQMRHELAAIREERAEVEAAIQEHHELRAEKADIRADTLRLLHRISEFAVEIQKMAADLHQVIDQKAGEHD